MGVFRVIRYSRTIDQLCANDRCMSGTVQMSCAVSCGCHGIEKFCNRLTQNAVLLKNDWTVTMMTSVWVMVEMF